MALTQEQQWGLAYLAQLYNDTVDERNKQITQQNKFAPRDVPLIDLVTKLTVEEFADMKIAEMATQGYRQLIDYKKQLGLAKFDSLAPDKQAALLAQLELPDVLE